MSREIIENFLVLEGIDGAGTTTQMMNIASRLNSVSIQCKTGCEPTDGPMGQLIRDILSGEKKATPKSVALLFAADRDDHINNGAESVSELCKEGILTLSDRYFFSSLAYQTVELPYEFVYDLNKDFPLPQWLVFLRINPEESLKRLDSRKSRDIYENLKFQKRVTENYERILESFSDSGMNIIDIDAKLPADDITDIIIEKLNI